MTFRYIDKLFQSRKILFYKLCFLCDGYRVSRESDVSEFWGPQTVISHSNMLKHFIQSRMNNTRPSGMPRISEVVTCTAIPLLTTRKSAVTTSDERTVQGSFSKNHDFGSRSRYLGHGKVIASYRIILGVITYPLHAIDTCFWRESLQIYDISQRA